MSTKVVIDLGLLAEHFDYMQAESRLLRRDRKLPEIIVIEANPDIEERVEKALQEKQK